MEFTTHFEQHSQTTRLLGNATYMSQSYQVMDGIVTLNDTVFQRIYTWPRQVGSSLNLQRAMETIEL